MHFVENCPELYGIVDFAIWTIFYNICKENPEMLYSNLLFSVLLLSYRTLKSDNLKQLTYIVNMVFNLPSAECMYEYYSISVDFEGTAKMSTVIKLFCLLVIVKGYVFIPVDFVGTH